MTATLAITFQVLLAAALLGLAAETVVLLLGLRRWWSLTRGPVCPPASPGRDDVPVCFVLVDVEPTVAGVRGLLDRLSEEHGSGTRPFEAHIVLPGSAKSSRDLLEGLGAVRLPKEAENLEAFAVTVGWGGRLLFQGDNDFGELLQSVAETARSPYLAVLPADALPLSAQLDVMTQALAERSDDPLVLGSPAAFAFRGTHPSASWGELRLGTARRSALLAWGGPGPLGMSAFWAAPVLATRERILETADAPALDRAEWLEQLGAAARGRAITVTPDTSSVSAAAGLAPFWISGSGRWLVHAAWVVLSALAPARALLVGITVFLAALGGLHASWIVSAFALAVLAPSSLRFLGQLGLEIAWPPAGPLRLLRLAVGSTCLAPFASGLARRGWI